MYIYIYECLKVLNKIYFYQIFKYNRGIIKFYIEYKLF